MSPSSSALRHQRGHRIHHNDVHGARADQRFGDFQRLLAVVWLRHQKIIHIHAELARVDRIERVFGVDERGLAAESSALGR